MPNRIIKESLCTSEKVSALSDFEFRLWIGLITQADDMGRGDARPAIIKGRVFPLRDRVATRDIEAALHGLAAKGCVSLYTVGGKPYFWFPTWGAHQRIRECKAKFPSPDEADGSTEKGLCGDLRRVAADCGNLRPESNPNPNPIQSNYFCAEPETGSTPVFALPLNDGTLYEISQKQAEEWAELYPAVDILQELRHMKGWLDANPTKKKTRRGILRFITGWLARTQDKGGNKKNAGTGLCGAAAQPELHVQRL